MHGCASVQGGEKRLGFLRAEAESIGFIYRSGGLGVDRTYAIGRPNADPGAANHVLAIHKSPNSTVAAAIAVVA